jgi:predicted MPP superfamily phosphohydrolase
VSTTVAIFWLASLVAILAIVTVARRRRPGLFVRFAGVFLGLHTLLAGGIVAHVGPLLPLFVALHVALYVHILALSKPRMRPLAYRVLVSLPSQYFAAGVFLSFPWAIAHALGFSPPGLWAPFLLAGVGLLQSMTLRQEEVDITIDRAPVGDLARRPLARAAAPAQPSESRPLRIVQITDPHLGPFMSVERLRSICERAVAKDPDLVLLTGDFLTMESQETDAHLTRAMEPLKALRGRVFACRGNHDHEAPDLVANALASAGVRLLVDEAELVETPAGPVQIVGMDFHFRDRAERMAAVVDRYPRAAGALRLVLLHDPGAFRLLPEGEGDLVLSGHTHGGQLGLVSLGIPHTVLRLLVDMPDHGFWSRGRDRLYVHRGTGHYGFPLRLGVPAEESLMRVHLAT